MLSENPKLFKVHYQLCTEQNSSNTWQSHDETHHKRLRIFADLIRAGQTGRFHWIRPSEWAYQRHQRNVVFVRFTIVIFRPSHLLDLLVPAQSVHLEQIEGREDEFEPTRSLVNTQGEQQPPLGGRRSNSRLDNRPNSCHRNLGRKEIVRNGKWWGEWGEWWEMQITSGHNHWTTGHNLLITSERLSSHKRHWLWRLTERHKRDQGEVSHWK